MMTVTELLSIVFYSLDATISTSDNDVTTAVYNNMRVTMDERANNRFYVQVKIGGVRIITTTSSATFCRELLENLLDSCDLIEV